MVDMFGVEEVAGWVELDPGPLVLEGGGDRASSFLRIKSRSAHDSSKADK